MRSETLSKTLSTVAFFKLQRLQNVTSLGWLIGANRLALFYAVNSVKNKETKAKKQPKGVTFVLCLAATMTFI